MIELLVVVTIMAVLASGVSLVSARGTSTAQADVARFQRLFTQARDRALITGQTQGLYLTGNGLKWAGSVPGSAGRNWQPVGRGQTWQGTVRFAPRETPVSSAGGGLPDILFLSTGQSSAFEATFLEDNWRGDRAVFLCRGDGHGLPRCAAG
ncbi:GspH/FimT family pseudopilin [Maritimibacter alkaliphilus]|nr:GspH/FimT family pseudopilin [Maritimibacter alkaliphilus]MBY6092511.1 GspH/FimT family pseudopilin [Maritimibacter alkaliphilus]